MNDESILTSIKLALGITEEDTAFDPQIIMFINSVFPSLLQLGVGPEGGYAIKDNSNIWSEFINDDLKLENVKTYIYLKVKLIFDPPASSSTIDVIERIIKEIEWRLTLKEEEGTTNVE